MITIDTIRPEFVSHEGFVYLMWEGEAYKGCRRCGGEGHYSFNGEHSRCYECDNNGSAKLGEHLGSVAEAEKWCHGKALRRAAAERKREREHDALLVKQAAKIEGVRSRDAGVADFLLSVVLEGEWGYDKDGHSVWNDSKVEKSVFILEMAEQLQFEAKAERVFSDKMVAAVRKTIDSRAEKAAAKAANSNPVVEGRIVITGKVISTKTTPDNGYGEGYKMLVEDERGFRVYGSIPSSLWNDVEFLGGYRKLAWGETDGVMVKLVGMELTFTATVEASHDDASFGFFKRPTKATIVA